MKNKLEELSAYEIGKLVNNKEISPLEVIQYFKKRILELNPTINAFVYLDFNYAENKAKELEKRINRGEYVGPFAGVPFALKDFLSSKKGWKHSFGGVKSLISEDEYDSPFCEAMEKAGGIAIGKTNAPTFGFRGTTDNLLYGPTKNPYNLKYNAGGSSGGSAAAISSGLVPIAEGGDAGGSIRIPASWNNLYGLKSSFGTVANFNRPDAYSATHPYCVNGGITKSLEDSAILLNFMSKYDDRDPFSYPKKDIDYLKEMKKTSKDIKVAFTYDFDIFEVEDEIKNIMLKYVNKLKKAGICVDFVHFNFPRKSFEYAEKWCQSISIDTAIEMKLLKEQGIDINDELPKEFIHYNKLASKWGIDEFYDFNLARTEIYDALQDVLDDYDVIISPTTCCGPVLNSKNTLGPRLINNVKTNRIIGFAETFLTNFSGHPSISIPMGFNKKHLPVGLQIIGKRFCDEDVLKAAYTFEHSI